MSDDVIVHIGAPKTGSSAIQRFCSYNRAVLRRSGFYYPKHPLDKNGVSGGHAEFSNALIDGDLDRAGRWLSGHLRKAKRRHEILLISAEGLYLQYENTKVIFDRFDDCSVRVIAYFRNPIEAMVSNYNQGIKRHFSVNRLDQYLKEQIDSAPYLYFGGAAFYEWRRLFQSVEVKPYVNERFVNKSLERDFLKFLAIPTDNFTDFAFLDQYVNNSYCHAATNLKRLLNLLMESEHNAITDKIDLLLQEFSDCNPETTLPYPVQIGQLRLAELRELFSEQLQRLCTDFFDNFPAESWLTPTTEEWSDTAESDRLLTIEQVFDTAIKPHEDIARYLENCIRSMLADSGALPVELKPIVDRLGLSPTNGQWRPA